MSTLPRLLKSLESDDEHACGNKSKPIHWSGNATIPLLKGHPHNENAFLVLPARLATSVFFSFEVLEDAAGGGMSEYKPRNRMEADKG